MAEFEHSLISERTKAGLAALQAAGQDPGPAADPHTGTDRPRTALRRGPWDHTFRGRTEHYSQKPPTLIPHETLARYGR